MSYLKILKLVLLICSFSLGGVTTTSAIPVQFEYNGAILFTDVTGLSDGDPAKITVTLDNGGSSLFNQVWTASDLESVEFNFNSGVLVTTFSDPFDGGLVSTAGNFSTDGSGVLATVMTSWSDSSVTANITTNGSNGNSLGLGWLLDGDVQTYRDQFHDQDVYLVEDSVTNVANWSPVSAVPVPAAVWLMGSGLIGLMGFRKKKVLDSA